MNKLSGLLIIVGLALVGCGNSPCEDAAEKVKECGVSDSMASGEGDCSGATECYAECINNASCADLKSAELDSAFVKCVAGCS